MLVAIPSRSYFEALELAPDLAGEEEIRAAYKKLVRPYLSPPAEVLTAFSGFEMAPRPSYDR